MVISLNVWHFHHIRGDLTFWLRYNRRSLFWICIHGRCIESLQGETCCWTTLLQHFVFITQKANHKNLENLFSKCFHATCNNALQQHRVNRMHVCLCPEHSINKGGALFHILLLLQTWLHKQRKTTRQIMCNRKRSSWWQERVLQRDEVVAGLNCCAAVKTFLMK